MTVARPKRVWKWDVRPVGKDWEHWHVYAMVGDHFAADIHFTSSYVADRVLNWKREWESNRPWRLVVWATRLWRAVKCWLA